MHILQIHNRYVQLGGEDFVIAQEKQLLENAGHQVSQYIVSNEDINTTTKKVKAALVMPYNISQKEKLEELLTQIKPDIVHIHNVFPILSPAIIDAIYAQEIPIVVTLHNYRLLCLNGIFYRNGCVCTQCIDMPFASSGVIHGCYQDSSIASIFPAITNYIHSKRKTWQEKVFKFIMLSEFTKSIFETSHLEIPNDKIVIKANFAPDQKPLYEKQKYFLFVGRLSEEKGIKTVITACIASGDVIKIAGEGPLFNWVKSLSRKHKNIIVLGFQTQSELKSLYAGARALLYASRWYETFGLVIIEAFSFGTPVIAPDFGNAGVFVKEGVNGMKYKLDSSKSLITVIQNFKNNNDELTLRKGARNSYVQNFTPEINLTKLLRVYNEAKK